MVCLDFQISCTSQMISGLFGVYFRKDNSRTSNEISNNINNLISLQKKKNCKRKLEKKIKFYSFAFQPHWPHTLHRSRFSSL